jgi:hypothetical protein
MMNDDRNKEAPAARHAPDAHLLRHLDILSRPDVRGAVPTSSPLTRHLEECPPCVQRLETLRERIAAADEIAAGILLATSTNSDAVGMDLLAGSSPRPVAGSVAWPERDAVFRWRDTQQFPLQQPAADLPRDTLGEARDALARISLTAGSLENTALMLCDEVIETFSHRLAAFQVIHPHKQVIETVAARGEAREWIGAAEHSLHGLRDIQADIALSKRGEIVTGKDPRLDPYLYRVYGHKDATRCFLPVAILRNPTAEGPRSVGWRLEGDRRIVPTDPIDQCEVVGTLESGYLSPKTEETITGDDLLRVAELASAHAAPIYRTTFRPALESIAGLLIRLSGTSSASVHLLRERYAPPRPDAPADLFSYNVRVGKALERESGPSAYVPGAISASPRRTGLGFLALEEGRALVIPDPTSERQDWRARDALRTFNSTIWDQGVRAMAAFPIEESDLHGLIYLHQFQEHTWNPRQVRQIETFVRREVARTVLEIINAIEERERSRQFAALNNMLYYRASVGEKQPHLDDLAWQVRTVLGADVAAILVRTQEKWSTASMVGASAVPYLDVKLAEFLWEQDHDNRGLFFPDLSNAQFSDLLHQGDALVSAAAHALPIRRENVDAVLFVGFQSYRPFRPGDREVMRQVARLTASVIEGRPAAEASLAEMARDVSKQLFGRSEFGDVWPDLQRRRYRLI